VSVVLRAGNAREDDHKAGTNRGARWNFELCHAFSITDRTTRFNRAIAPG
jgi:hypothetical protein